MKKVFRRAHPLYSSLPSMLLALALASACTSRGKTPSSKLIGRHVQALGTTAIAPLPVEVSTGSKPQSKIWSHNGQWWAVLALSGNAQVQQGTWVLRLVDQSWEPITRIRGSVSKKSDVWREGNRVFVLRMAEAMARCLPSEHPNTKSAELVILQHDLVSNEYLEIGNSSFEVPFCSETSTLALDTHSRLWAVYDAHDQAGDRIEVRHRAADSGNWSEPIALAGDISADDIAVITRFSDLATESSIGVLWSNQNTRRFGFRYRRDNWDNLTQWSADEEPRRSEAESHFGVCTGANDCGMADDHLNVATHSNGTLYAAVKTSYGTGDMSYPHLGLLVRRPGGTWDPLHPVDVNGSRPLVLLNEQRGRLSVVYQHDEEGTSISFKESTLEAIEFSPEFTLLNEGASDVTSTKQRVSTAVPVIATDADDNGVDIAMTARVCLGHVHSKALRAHWAMDDGAEVSAIEDSSGAGHDALVQGAPTPIGAMHGLGRHLSGSGDFALVADSVELDVSDKITMALWVKPEQQSTQYLIKKAIANQVDGYELSLSSRGQAFLRFNQDAQGNSLRLDSVQNYPSDGDTWVHLAATFDGLKARLYVNGQLDSEAVWGGGVIISSNSLPLVIGADSAGLKSLHGSVDDVYLFGRALTPLEIALLAERSPLGWWSLDTLDGNLVADESGHCHEGRRQGGLAVSGAMGGALQFNGQSDVVLVESQPSLDVQSATTLAIWLKPERVGTQYLLKKAIQGQVDGYELSLSSSGRAFARFNQASTGNRYRINATTEYPTDAATWQHLAVTYDGAVMRLYVDGVEEAQLNGNFSIAVNSLPLALGAQSNETVAFQGALDEPQIYDRALSAEEVALLASQQTLP